MTPSFHAPLACYRPLRQLLRIHRCPTSSPSGVQNSVCCRAYSEQAQVGKRPPRFYVPEKQLQHSQPGATFQLGAEETHHALKVLRLREGAPLEICDGNGTITAAFLRGIGHNHKAFVETSQPAKIMPWQGPKWEVVAACFSLKGGRSDFLVEKASELGAFSLRPILTVRSPYLGRKQIVIEVADIDADSEEELEDVETPDIKKKNRWRRVAQAATKQCLRSTTMAIRAPLHVSQLAGHVEKCSMALVGVEGAPAISEVMQREAEAVAGMARPGSKPGLLLVGPEGDFTKEELQVLIDAGARPVGLGPNRLRVETAAMAMLTAVTLGSG